LGVEYAKKHQYTANTLDCKYTFSTPWTPYELVPNMLTFVQQNYIKLNGIICFNRNYETFSNISCVFS